MPSPDMLMEVEEQGGSLHVASTPTLRHRAPSTTAASPGALKSDSFEGGVVRYPVHGRPKTLLEKLLQRVTGGNLPSYLCLEDFGSPAVLRGATVEFVGTTFLTYLGIITAITCISQGLTPPGRAIGIVNGTLLALFIMATGPASGGHLNPAVTLGTFFIGKSSLPRTLLYIVAQVVGAILGALMAKGVLDDKTVKMYSLGGCKLRLTIPNAAGLPELQGLSDARGFLAEFAAVYSLLFVIGGVALDPLQGSVFGQTFVPAVIGGLVGLITFSSGGLVPGYLGAGINPSRCIGSAVVMGDYDGLWVFVVAPLVAALAQAGTYLAVPPLEDPKRPGIWTILVNWSCGGGGEVEVPPPEKDP